MNVRQLAVGTVIGMCACACFGSSVVTDGDNQLVYTVDAGETNVVSAALPTTVARLVKRGAGALRLAAANGSFSKPIDVEEGTLQVSVTKALGTGTVTISNGARLEALLTGCEQSVCYFPDPQILVSGSGPDGEGAIYFSGSGAGDRLFRRVKLLGDTVVGTKSSRWGVAGQSSAGELDLNGFTLDASRFPTMLTMFMFNSDKCKILNPGHIRISYACMQSGPVLNGSSANTITLAKAGGKLQFWSMSAQPTWTIDVAANASIRAGGGSGTTRSNNRWNGPITIQDGCTLTFMRDDSDNNLIDIRGAISGAGSLVKQQDNQLFLDGRCTYTGGTRLEGGTTFCGATYTLADYNVPGKVTVTNSAVLSFWAPGWSEANIKTCVGCANWAQTAYVEYNGAEPRTHSEDFGKPVSYALRTGTLNLTAPLHGYAKLKTVGGTMNVRTSESFESPSLSLSGGTTTLSGGGFMDIEGGSGSMTGGRLVVSNFTIVALYGSKGATKNITISGTSKPVLEICDGAIISNKLVIGNASGQQGAVYQRGGRLRSLSRGENDTYVGENGYGYYEVSDGVADFNGWMGFGHKTGAGVLQITGGTNKFDVLPISRGGYGRMYMSGGTLTGSSVLFLGEQQWGGGTDVGDSFVTVDGTADVTASEVQICQRTNNFTAALNLNGGRLCANAVFEPNYQPSLRSASAKSYLNFNGGTLRARQTRSQFFGSTGYQLDRVTAFGRGAFIDTQTYNVDNGQVPIQKPTGRGIKRITYPANTATNNYIGSPEVYISGGGGVGASAYVTFDSKSQTIGAVVVTSPGWDYTEPPTVKFYNAGRTAFVTCDVELTDGDEQASGGLVKLGTGTFTVTQPCTYTGDTIVSNGTFKLGCANALPVDNTVRLATGDSTFHLNDNTVTLGGFGGAGTVAGGTGAALTVTRKLVFDPGDLVAGQKLSVSAVPLTLEPGVDVEIVNPDALPVGSYTLATASAGTFSHVSGVNMPTPWKVVVADNGARLKLVYMRATTLILR